MITLGDIETLYRIEHEAELEAQEWASDDPKGFVSFVSGMNVLIERAKEVSKGE